MVINYEFNFWENLIAMTSLIVSSIIAIIIYRLSTSLSQKDEFNHEQKITEEVSKLTLYQSVILADVKKYKPFLSNYSNENYYQQGAELYTIIPAFGVQVILLPTDEKIPVGIIPFSWIEVVRKSDSMDNKPIIVCKFKGVKWYKNFKSPFKEINYFYKDTSYKKGFDPLFSEYRPFK